MTVQQLIDALSKLNPNAVVLINDNDDWTYEDINVLTLTDHADLFVDDEHNIERIAYAMDYVAANRIAGELDPVILSYLT